MPAGLMPRLGRLLPSLGPPLLLFWVSILGFGLQVGKLGFYWDDWAHIWWSQMQGLQGIWASTWYDRPLIGLFTMSLFVLTKWNPLVLHILCWLVSWLTALLLWACLRRTWPQRGLEALMASLLYMVTPALSIQHISLVSLNLFGSQGVELCSIWLFLIALDQERPGRRWTFHLAAALLAGVSWSIYEANFFLEPLRWCLLLAWLGQRQGSGFWRALWQGKTQELAWIGFSLAFLLWRLLWAPSQRDASQAMAHALGDLPGYAIQVFSNWINCLAHAWLFPNWVALPLTPGLHIVIGLGLALMGVVAWVVWAWRQRRETMLNLPFSPSQGLIEFGWALAVLLVILAGLFLPRQASGPRLYVYQPWPQLAVFVLLAAGMLTAWLRGRKQDQTETWPWPWIALGGLSSLAGLALLGLADQHPVLNNFRDRWNLPALAGCSMMLVGLLGLMRNRATRAGLASLLVGLGLFFHHANTYQLKINWDYQRDLMWQLWQRAPRIQPGTVLVLDSGEGIDIHTFKYYSMYGLTSIAYGLKSPDQQVGTWILGAARDQHNQRALLDGIKETQGSRQTDFPVDWSKVLVLSKPSRESCLYILEGKHPVAPPHVAAQALANASSTRLEVISPERGPQPPAYIYGPEPCGWCAYYQKAQLAAQFGRWDEVTALYEQAQGKGFSAQESQELLPFVEAYVRTGQRDQARKLAREMDDILIPSARLQKILGLPAGSSTP